MATTWHCGRDDSFAANKSCGGSEQETQIRIRTRTRAPNRRGRQSIIRGTKPARPAPGTSPRTAQTGTKTPAAPHASPQNRPAHARAATAGVGVPSTVAEEGVAVAVAMYASHAAIVADGYVYVPVVEMLPIQMPSCPRIASTASAASSPPVTVPPTTSPVSLFPRMNSRRMVNACGAAGGQRVRKGEGGGGGGGGRTREGLL